MIRLAFGPSSENLDGIGSTRNLHFTVSLLHEGQAASVPLLSVPALLSLPALWHC